MWTCVPYPCWQIARRHKLPIWFPWGPACRRSTEVWKFLLWDSLLMLMKMLMMQSEESHSLNFIRQYSGHCQSSKHGTLRMHFYQYPLIFLLLESSLFLFLGQLFIVILKLLQQRLVFLHFWLQLLQFIKCDYLFKEQSLKGFLSCFLTEFSVDKR